MKVRELIERLQKLNRPNSEVVIDTHACCYCFDDITEVTALDVVYLKGNKANA